MNPPNMILHIINPTKNPPTTRPLTKHPRIMPSLVPSTIFIRRKPTINRLRTPLVATEEVLTVLIVMFPEVADATEGSRGGAGGVCAPIRPVGEGVDVG